VRPRSRTQSLEREADGTFRANLKSSPADGKANAELIELVARHFKRRRSAVSIKSGASARSKLLSIDDE